MDIAAGSKSMDNKKKIRETWSVCPVCLKKIPAVLTENKEQVIFLEKNCKEHGAFCLPVWKGNFDYHDWIVRELPMSAEESDNCSGDCRMCGSHGQGTCCVILEVTKSCNLRCPWCFARGGEDGEMPSFDRLRKDIDRITEVAGDPLLQLSGGEPTLRDDLPELVKYAKKAGCSYTQINTNGIRLAGDEAYVKALAEAGLDIVFLQFDGVDDQVYQTLRGRPLLDIKYQAIRNCDKYRIGVTLVPTIVRGVNDDRTGDIIRAAIKLFPAVRSVHFQPVTYLGRYPGQTQPEDRYTLDELMVDLVGQTGIPRRALLPSRCDHAACEFHSTFLIDEERQMIPVSDRSADRREKRTAARDNRVYVAEHWKRPETAPDLCADYSAPDPGTPIEFAATDQLDFDTFIRYMKSRTLKISAMAFQDAMNLDLERLGRCSLHVYEKGRLLPFCGKYLTPASRNEYD